MNALAAAFRIKPGAKLNPARGIRTAAAALVSLLVLATMHHVALGTEAALGALLVSLCDAGSSVRARAEAMGVTTIAAALLFALGRSMGDQWWLAIPAIFLVTLAAGIIGVYGQSAFALGLIPNIVFALGLGVGGGPSTALPALFGFLIGGTCALLFAVAPMLVRRLRAGSASVSSDTAPTASPRITQLSLASLVAHLSLSSSVVRFAVLRAVGAAVAAAISWSLGVSHPHWAVLPVIVCAMPDPNVSLVATAQFAAGTVFGAILAEVVIATTPDSLVLALFAVALMIVAFTVRDLSLAFWTFFLTIMLLLLISIPTGGLSLAGLKVFEALIGAAIALAVTYLGTRITGEPTAQHAHM